ncbi:MAG TPA: RNA-binding domain-containing protein [Candidatus Methanofastidiosa archaeon]|nr:RNA-binding domain-containing protein [Candidatus Methanofastidiosa archaeon]
MNITVSTRVNPTEDESKVRKALKNIFSGMEFVMEDGRLVGRSDSIEDLSTLKELIESQCIRDSARKTMRKGSGENLVRFCLNKQAATKSKINFSDESPLGPIRVSIRGDVNEIYDYIAPSTI